MSRFFYSDLCAVRAKLESSPGTAESFASDDPLMAVREAIINLKIDRIDKKRKAAPYHAAFGAIPGKRYAEINIEIPLANVNNATPIASPVWEALLCASGMTNAEPAAATATSEWDAGPYDSTGLGGDADAICYVPRSLKYRPAVHAYGEDAATLEFWDFADDAYQDPADDKWYNVQVYRPFGCKFNFEIKASVDDEAVISFNGFGMINTSGGSLAPSILYPVVGGTGIAMDETFDELSDTLVVTDATLQYGGDDLVAQSLSVSAGWTVEQRESVSLGAGGLAGYTLKREGSPTGTMELELQGESEVARIAAQIAGSKSKLVLHCQSAETYSGAGVYVTIEMPLVQLDGSDTNKAETIKENQPFTLCQRTDAGDDYLGIRFSTTDLSATPIFS